MRHRVAGYQLGRDRDHRKALRRNLTRSLFLHGKVVTTTAKAKATRPFAEHLITLAKRGDLAARRRVIALLGHADVVKKLFDEIAPSFADRAGGYTRVLRTYAGKTLNRLGDNGQVSIFELVGREEKTPKPGKKSKRRRGNKEAKETKEAKEAKS